MIIFSKDLLPINPAYNDSIIQFSSDSITEATKAIITIEGDSFITVPLNGIFTFNLKGIITAKINTNRLEDTIFPDLSTGEISYADENIGRNFEVDIEVQNNVTSEVITKMYYFQRSVEQLPNYRRLSELPSDVKVLLPSDNYLDYQVKMTEGYPFDIAVNGLAEGDTYQLKNITTNDATPIYTAATNNAVRLFISDGAFDTTNTNTLFISSMMNHVELWVNGSFKANVRVNKIDSQCGIYLKWVNTEGSYSYWLFDSIFKDTLIPKTVDELAGSYDNLQNLNSASFILGKTARRTLQLNTIFDKTEAEYLSDLSISPVVWMYAHQVPFQQVQDRYDWIGVTLNDGQFPVENKTNKNKFSTTITLPNVNTITQ
ncbi:hypothetical protein [Flavobacterium sp.]|uniref:hypothetical protein n=1 Tax=Flavobacterium sp. TaxID=239 RepID=UPI0040343FA0